MGAHERDGGVEHVDASRRHDYAGACGEFIVLERYPRLIQVDLQSGGMVDLSSLQCVPLLQVKGSTVQLVEAHIGSPFICFLFLVHFGY